MRRMRQEVPRQLVIDAVGCEAMAGLASLTAADLSAARCEKAAAGLRALARSLRVEALALRARAGALDVRDRMPRL